MSFSWVFVASFEIPADQLAAFKKSHPARKTDEDAIVRDPQLNDCSYKKNRFECRWLFEKSQYADTVAEIDGLCGDVLAAGGTGEGSIVGYVDGPTDEGDRFRVAAGAVAHEALDATAAQTVTKSAAYKAVEKRMKQAFEPKPLADTGGGLAQVMARLDASLHDPLTRLVAALEALPDDTLNAAAARRNELTFFEKGRFQNVALGNAKKLRAALKKWPFDEADTLFAHLLSVLAAADKVAAVDLASDVLTGKPLIHLATEAVEIALTGPRAVLALDHLDTLLPFIERETPELLVEDLAEAKAIPTAELGNRCRARGFHEPTDELLSAGPTVMAAVVFLRDDDLAVSAELDDRRVSNPARFRVLTRLMRALHAPARGKAPDFGTDRIQQVAEELPLQMASRSSWAYDALQAWWTEPQSINYLAFELCTGLERDFIEPGDGRLKKLLADEPRWRELIERIGNEKLAPEAMVESIREAIAQEG